MATPAVKPRTTTVLLYQGDDRDRIAQLLTEVKVAAAKFDGPSRIGDTPAVDAVEAYNAFLVEAEPRAVKVVLVAQGRRKWRDMVREQTSTKTVKSGEDQDATTSEVEELDHEALADMLVPASVIEPAFDTRAELDGFLDALNDADFNRLYSAAWMLNESSGVVDPKALSVSDLIPSSDETSSSPEPLA